VGKAPLSPYPPDPAEDAEADPGSNELVDVVVEDEDWANRRSPRFSARRVELRSCRLTGAELGEATLADVSFVECRVDLVGLRFAKLERVVFSGCRMNDCDFYGATLKDVLFEHCELREATFSTATLRNVEVRGCELAGLNGVEAFRGVRMPWNDVLANALLFAGALGIDVID
jgi:uncharacterized protein YjbI with pentapeptide repeats